MQVIAPPGVFIWGAPRHGAAVASLMAAAAPSEYNRHRLKDSSHRSFPMFHQDPELAARSSRGVDSSAASAVPSWAPAPPPEAYNMGRLKPAIVRITPVGSPPTNAKSEVYLKAAAADGINVTAPVGKIGTPIDPIALHARVKALMEGNLDPDEKELFEQYVARLKIYAAISKARPLTNAEQAAVDDIAQDVSQRTEALAQEDALAVAERDANIRIAEHDLADAELAEKEAKGFLLAGEDIRTGIVNNGHAVGAQVAHEADAMLAAAQAKVAVIDSRLVILDNIREDLALESQVLADMRQQRFDEYQAQTAKREQCLGELGDPHIGKTRRRELADRIARADAKIAKLESEIFKIETEQKERTPVIRKIREDLEAEMGELEAERNLAPVRAAAVAESLIDSHERKINQTLASHDVKAARAARVLEEKPYEAALTRRERAPGFVPNKRFASRDSDIENFERFIAEQFDVIKEELGVAPPPDDTIIVPESKEEKEANKLEEKEPEKLKAEASQKLSRYKVKGADGFDTLDKFIQLHAGSGANSVKFFNVKDVPSKVNKGIYGLNTLWRNMYPGENIPWEGHKLNSEKIAKIIAGRPGNDALLKTIARKLQDKPEFRVRVLEQHGWEAPEPASDADSEEEA